MPSTYTVNLGIEKPATGEQSGTWGDTTNINFDILDQAINGAISLTLASAGTSGSPNTLAISDGAVSDGRNKWIEFVDGGDLGATAYVQLTPNDAEKIVFIRNSLSGSRSVILFQGTYDAARDLEVPAGVDMVVKFSGGGATATVTDVFTRLRVTAIETPSLTATTADINGGTIDGATVGASSASTGAFTTLTASTSLNIASSTTVDGVLDEDNMASNSATKLATQQSIKAYVDSQVGTVDTWAEVLANGATSGATNPEVTAGQALKTDTINETTAGSGVTIDSVLVKDNSVKATTLKATNLQANDGTAAGSIADSTGLVTLTSVDINGGNIDGTTIGGTSTANGSFSTLTGATINATSVIDTPDIETARISARDGTTAINIADSTGAVDIDTSLNVDGTITGDGLTIVTGSDGLVARLTGSVSSRGLEIATFTESGSGSAGVDFNVDSGSTVGVMTFSSDSTEHWKMDKSGGMIITPAAGGNAIFNEGGVDADFRVESDSYTHMLFVDAGSNKVNIGDASGSYDLNVRKTMAGGDVGFQISNRDTSQTAGTRAILALQADVDNDGDLEEFLHIRGGTSTSGFAEFVAREGTSIRFQGDASTSVVFNDSGVDQDFRVESDTNEYAVFVDAGNSVVAVGTQQTTDPWTGYTPLAVGNQLMIGSTGAGATFTNIVHGAYYDGADWLQRATDVTVARHEMIGGASGAQHNFYTATNVTADTATTQILNLSFTPTTAVFNEDSRDIDFRVESDASTHMLFVDAGNSRIGVNSSSPAYTLDVVGNIAITSATSLIGKNAVGGDTQLLYWSGGVVYYGRNTLGGSVNGHEFRTNGVTRLNVKLDGEIGISTNADLDTNGASTSSTSQVAIYTFSATTYTGAKLLVCVTDSTATERYITEILVTHDGSTAVSTEYGQVATDTALATFDVDIFGGSVRLLATPASSNSMTFKVMSTQLLA